MKVVALLLCGLAVAAANEHWENFKIKHGKSYANLEDESYRKSVYENNQKTIDAHNERFQQGLVTFDMAMNQFGDMIQEEIVATMHGLSKEVNHPRRQRVAAHKTSSKPLANAVDWRDEGAVTHVKDQGACGSCWAFSATGALEGQHFLSAGKLVSLSEQNLVDCSSAYGNDGCNGGWPYWAYQYISDNKGIDTEHSYPYEAIDNVCRYDSSSIGATCTGYVDIKKGDEGDLQDAVQNIGPISVAIDASQTSFSFYSSGVYYEPSCSSHLLDHAVLTVGYGVEGTDEYWLVKNSWAKSWGDQGYIKMARNRHNNCGIATAAVYPSV